MPKDTVVSAELSLILADDDKFPNPTKVSFRYLKIFYNPKKTPLISVRPFEVHLRPIAGFECDSVRVGQKSMSWRGAGQS